MNQPYTFKAELHHAWDGDTIWLVMDRGEGWQSKGKYRLYGVDTPEIRGATDEEEQYAREAKDFLEERLSDRVLVVSTHRGDSKYDWMAEIWIERDNEQGDKTPMHGTLQTTNGFTGLADCLITCGHGVPYFGGKKLPWPERKAIQDAARAKLLTGQE